MSHIIAISGPMYAGKSQAAKYFVEKYAFEHVSFAAPLKAIAAHVTPDGLIDKGRDRELLQFLGTSYYRDTVDKDYWVKLAMQKIDELNRKSISVVIDDVRFANEFIALKKRLAVFIHVEADKSTIVLRARERDGILNFKPSKHESENNQLGRDLANYTVRNNRDLRKFEIQLDEIITTHLNHYYTQPMVISDA